MFASMSRFRRQVAVLSVLALVASVLAAAPAVAADDPKADYTATFDACVGVGSADFADVPASHTNAGDIDCIAYYAITQGTGDGNYSPTMSVSREHMALFLARLAGKVGIEMASDPDDAGFTDIGELSAESQTAINQIADLEITVGFGSTTTYAPGESVQRDHMALFIARLMNLMDPMAEDDDTGFGFIPDDVVDVPDGDDADDVADKTVKSPFTDINSTTKEAYDAITELWELGVASGISATAYAPSANITRAAMAEFMTGVLDHSNARPAGVTIQASKTWAFDGYDATVAVSYRDDSFAPMVDVSIKTFFANNDGAEDGVGEFTEDGGCQTPADCAWTDDESLTDDSGNLYLTGGVVDGKTNTYYAWMGDADADDNDFNVDDSDHASVTMSSTRDATELKVTSTISDNSTTDNTVDIDGKGSVTYTVQLVDGDDDAVAKSGVEISVSVVQGDATLYPAPADLVTDDDGQATYTTGGPKSTKGSDDADRADTVTFSADVNEDDTDETSENTINWTDADAVLTSGEGSAPSYSVMNSKDEVTIRASVTFYDQYGNTIGKGNTVSIDIGAADAETRTVSSRGVASYRTTVDAGEPGTDIDVTYTGLADSTGTSINVTVDESNVTPVRHAPDDSSAAAADLDAVYADDNRFRIAGLLYTYDSDDTFVDGTDDGDGALVDMAKFESLITKSVSTADAANVQVVSYDDDGDSIFRVTDAAE